MSVNPDAYICVMAHTSMKLDAHDSHLQIHIFIYIYMNIYIYIYICMCQSLITQIKLHVKWSPCAHVHMQHGTHIMSHGAHVFESWCTYTWVKQISLVTYTNCHVTYVNESRHICEYVTWMNTSHGCESRRTYPNVTFAYRWLMVHISCPGAHITYKYIYIDDSWCTHIDDSWHTYRWLMVHISCPGAHITYKYIYIDDSWCTYRWLMVHTYRWLMAHI